MMPAMRQNRVANLYGMWLQDFTTKTERMQC